MIGDKSKFLSLTSIYSGHVTFGDNAKGKVIGKGRVTKSKHFGVEDVLLVKGLRQDLLRITQLYDKGNKIMFDSNCCVDENNNDK